MYSNKPDRESSSRPAKHPLSSDGTSVACSTTVPGRAGSARRREKILVLAGIIALSLNLRPAAVSIGPVLDEASRGLSMSATAAGVLTTAPVFAFAVFGAVAPWLARSVGIHRTTLGALLCVTMGLAGRAFTGSAMVFLALSLLAVAGMATANVLLPSLVKLHFPTKVGLLTSIYTTSLAIGVTVASVTTVPIAEGFGSWRIGLLVWAMTALLAAVPWVALIAHDRAPVEAPRAITLRDVAGTSLGWWMAVFFGLQSLQFYTAFGWFAQVYRDAGFSASTAGLLLGVMAATNIPLSLWLPTVTVRLQNPTWLIGSLLMCYPVAYMGLLLAPVAGAWGWAVMIGLGGSIFPIVLTLIGLRARTSAGTAALSGFTQSVGYLISVIGPFGVGLLYDATGGWTIPLLGLTVLCVPQIITGVMVSRPAYLEDALLSARPRSTEGNA